jgi:hypothetical protein
MNQKPGSDPPHPVIPGVRNFRSTDREPTTPHCHRSNLWIKIKKRVQALLELRFNLFPRPLNGVHCYMRLVTVGQFQGCILDLGDFAFWQQPQSVH